MHNGHIAKVSKYRNKDPKYYQAVESSDYYATLLCWARSEEVLRSSDSLVVQALESLSRSAHVLARRRSRSRRLLNTSDRDRIAARHGTHSVHVREGRPCRLVAVPGTVVCGVRFGRTAIEQSLRMRRSVALQVDGIRGRWYQQRCGDGFVGPNRGATRSHYIGIYGRKL